MCNICMLQFEAKALVELSASDEVWEGEIFLCVVCVCVCFLLFQIQRPSIPYVLCKRATTLACRCKSR